MYFFISKTKYVCLFISSFLFSEGHELILRLNDKAHGYGITQIQ